MNTEILMQVATQYAESMTRAALEDERCNEELAAQHHAQKREAHDKLQAMIYQLMAPNITDDDADLLAQAVRQLEEFSAQALTHGNSSEHHAAACSAHAVQKLAVALMSAQRCTKALVQIAEPAEDIWPCINIDVDEHGAITNAKLYSPGLPAGNHDVYPVRVPYMDEHTEAWLTCVKELERFDSSFLNREGMNGLECAASVIRELVSRAQRAAAPQAVQPAVPDGWKLVPMEPQDMQQVAGAQAIRFDTTVINKMWTANKVYREMVAAAPAHPAEGVPAQERLERLRVNPADEETPKYVYGDKYALLDVIALSTALEAAKKQLAATQPAAQGLDAPGWLPIETAPKDGSWIRLWREPSQEDWLFTEPETTARWCSERLIWTWPDDDYEVFTQYGRDKAEALIEGDDVYTSDEFTHWMRLPSMPAIAAQAKQGGAND